MAKKKKSPSKAKARAAAKQASVKTAAPKPVKIEAVPVEAAKKVTKPKVAKLVQVTPGAAPKIPVARAAWRPTALERLAIVLGLVLLVIGVVAMLQPRPAKHDTVSDDVKKQQIQMQFDDFKDDPAIQDAIRKQLGGEGTNAPNPQEQGQSAQSGNKASESLQSPASNLQAQ